VDRTHAEKLVTELGSKLGVPGMALDDADSCSLSLDDGVVTLRISYTEETDMFDFSARLDGLAPKPVHMARALGLNFCWQANAGATFALDARSSRLTLNRRCPAAELDLPGFSTALEKLAGNAIAWTKILGDMKEEAESSAAQSDAAAVRMPIGVRA
jgi:hypothetical protein